MITVDDLREARLIRDELRATGKEKKAAAIEHLLRLAEASVEGLLAPPPGDFITTGQAARALGVSLQTIKNWAAAGKFETVRLGGRIMVSRASLLAYLASLRSSSEKAPTTSAAETPADVEQRTFIQAGFPPALIERLRDLIDAMEDRPLTQQEQRELQDLERESTRISAERLRAWIERKAMGRPGVDAPGR